MPVDSEKALKVWARYAYCRDNGHQRYVDKADLCERFFAGDQWDPADRARLRMQQRPALTINKIISTMSNVMGEQIYNRAEIAFRPRSGAPSEVAEALTKVFKQISDTNQLPWKRSDMFADGIITSRGFIDARIDFDDSMQGSVRLVNLNPKNVILDPDGEEYDPDTWNEVTTTKWVTADDIAVLYSKADAEALRVKAHSAIPFGYDAIDHIRDRFGNSQSAYYMGAYDETSVTRNIRIIERQWKTLDRQKHFVAPATGDMRAIPANFDRDRIAWFVSSFGFKVIEKLVHRIKWIVVADDFVLHEEWSPYKHFTVVPYFPYFRHGHTIGLVENLLGPQELLNKVSSQELHVVNTSANSGWIVRSGALVNMSAEELEQRGAETGIVLEVGGDGALKDQIDKVSPNQTPTGLDRITYKADESIKSISGVSDSMQGQDREDVAAKAIQAKRQAGNTNFVKPMDSLTRSDFILARNVLDMVQEFYTEPRMLSITKDNLTGETENFQINQPTPDGQILNDLTLGEYEVVVSSVPQRETLEDSQFEQALSLKKDAGIPIPDEVLIDASRLQNKSDIKKAIAANKQNPDAQQAQQLQIRQQSADVDKTEAEVAQKRADAQLKLSKAQHTDVQAHVAATTPPETQQDTTHIEEAKAAHGMGMDEREFEHKQQIDFARLAMDQRSNEVDAALQAHDLAEQRAQQRAQQAQQANKPTEGATK